MPVHDDAAPPLTDRFAAALSLAWEVHGTQLRKKTDIPYMAHVMAVCALALENGADEDVGIAALLHDSVEDFDGRREDARAHRAGIRPAGRSRSSWPAAIRSRCPGGPNPRGASARRRTSTTSRPRRTAMRSLCRRATRSTTRHRSSPTFTPTGHDVWQRFTVADPSAQLWYYRSVAGILQRRLPGPLTARLGTIVDEMSALVP